MFFKVFEPEDDPLCLKCVANINTTDNVVVLTSLYSFINERELCKEFE